MKTTTFLFLLFLSPFFVYAQGKTCAMSIATGSGNGFRSSDAEEFVCKGGRLKLTCSNVGDGTYTWKKDGKAIPNENKYIFYATEEGTYTAEAQTKECKYVTPKVVYKLKDKLENHGFSINGEIRGGGINTNEYTLCNLGERININLDIYTANRNGDIDYQWQKEGIDLDGATASNMIIGREGIYTVRAQQGECVFQSKPLKINIKNENVTNRIMFNSRVSFVNQLADTLNVCDSTSIKLASNFFASSAHKWFKNNQQLKEFDSPNIVVSEPGVYSYETTLPGGCKVKSENLVIEFGKKLNKPNLRFTDYDGGCKDVALLFDDKQFYNQYIFSTVGKYKLSWYKNSVFQNNDAGVYVSLNESATYKVVVEIGSCRVEQTYNHDSSKPVIYKLSNNLIKNGRIDVCADEETVLEYLISDWALVKPYKFQWYKDGKPIEANSFKLKTKESGRYHAVFSSLDNTCTQYSDTVDVRVAKAPAIQIAKETLTNCVTQLKTIQTEGTTYFWKKDGRLIAGAKSFEFIPKEAGIYSLVSNQGYCAYESNKISVGVSEKYALTEKNTLCENDTLKLKSPTAESYLWKGPNNFSSNLQNPSLTNIKSVNSGIYTLTRKLGECFVKDSVAINVNLNPLITLDRADEFCLGRSLTIIAKTSNASVIWEDPMGKKYNSNTFSIAFSNISYAGVYKAIATDNSSKCTNAISTNVDLKEGLCTTIQLIPPGKGVCASGESELIFNVFGDFASDEIFTLYYINANGTKSAITTSGKSPIKIKDGSNYFMSISQSGNPRLMIESSKRKVQSNIIEVNVIDVAKSIEMPVYRKVCDGVVPMKLDSLAYSYDKIQWFKNNVAIPNANKYQYIATESGNYYARLEKDGCVFEKVLLGGIDVTIGEIEKPTVFGDIKDGIVNICQGFSSRLYTSAIKIKDLQYQWQLDGKDIPNATSESYIVQKGGYYTLKLKQHSCENFSVNVRVVEGDLLTPVINLSPYSYTPKKDFIEICEGTEVSMVCNNYSFSSENGRRFQWQKDNVDIPSATAKNYQAKESGTYRLKVSQGDCIVFSKPVIIKYGSPKALYFNAGSNNYCVDEHKNAYLNFNGIADSQLYAKIFKDNKPFTEAQGYKGVELLGSGDYHAVLNFLIPNTGKTCTLYSDTLKIRFHEKIINYNLPGAASLTECTDSLLITGYDPWATLEELEFNIGTSKTKYQWKLNGVNLPNANAKNLMAKQSGLYQLELKGESQCAYISNPVTVTLNKLEATIKKFSQLCFDSLSALNVSINSSLDYNSRPVYEWKLDGKTIGKESSQTVKNVGMYVMTTKQGKCTTSDSIRISSSDLKAAIPKTLTPNQDSLFICPKGTVSIGAPQGSDFTYSWFRNNQAFNGLNAHTISVSSEGAYKVWIEKGECGRMSNAVNVKEKIVLPKAVISGDNTIVPGDSTKIKIDLTSLPPWTIKLTNNQEFNATLTPFEFAVKPTQTTLYELASVINDCGLGTVSGKAEIKLLILGNEEPAGAKVKLYPVPTQGICQLSIETVVPEKMGFQLYNVEGKMMLTSEESRPDTSFKDVVNLESMPDGVYVLKIKIGKKILNRKIIKGN